MAKKEMLKKEEVRESNNTFIDFYDPKTKKAIVWTIDVKGVEKLPMKQEYYREKDKHTIVIPLKNGKDLCITPRVDKLGRLSTYLRDSIDADHREL